MALTKCPDCSKDISDSAPSCINCGRPMAQPNCSERISIKTTKRQNKWHFLGIDWSKPIYKSPIKKVKLLSIKSFLIAFCITVIIIFTGLVFNPGKIPIFYWTFIWILLTVEGWKYWKWKTLIPYPAYILCVALNAINLLVSGEKTQITPEMILGARMLNGVLNIAGIIIFTIIYYRRYKKEKINNQ